MLFYYLILMIVFICDFLRSLRLSIQKFLPGGYGLPVHYPLFVTAVASPLDLSFLERVEIY